MPSPPAAGSEAGGTYLALRVGMVLLVVLLFAGVGVHLLVTGAPGCFPHSLSAYYYTDVRPVLVAALAGLGTGLVVYRGTTDLEDVLLDAAGFLAFVVAFVPDRFPPDACDTTDAPSAPDVAAAVTDNVLALLITAVLAVAVRAVLRRGAAARSGGARVAAVVVPVLVLAAVVTFVVDPGLVRRAGHTAAAVGLFAAIVAVVVLNAVDAGRPGYRRWYAALAVVVPLVAVAAALLGGRARQFWVETALVVGFGVFWVVQTVELRGTAVRTDGVGGRLVGRRH